MEWEKNDVGGLRSGWMDQKEKKGKERNGIGIGCAVAKRVYHDDKLCHLSIETNRYISFTTL